MEGTPYRRLFPAGPDTDALRYTRELELGEARPGRPYVLANFVTSADGRATVGEDSRRLSGTADRELFYALRERVDAVLIGPRTLAAERYKRMLPAAERRERRRAAGRPAEPLAVTVTRSGPVPRDIPLFRDAPDRVLVIDGDGVPLDAVLATLRRDHGVATLLCEGGPTLFGALWRAGLVDELFLTVAPMLVGGASAPSLVGGPATDADPEELALLGALEREGTLFLRYRVGEMDAPPTTPTD